MNRIFIIPLFFVSLLINAQSLPKVIETSFHEQFPNVQINSWKDNNSYQPLTTDVLYPYDDMDGATAIPENTAPEEAKELNIKDPQAPTEYFLDFTLEKVDMIARFKADGTFVIAIGSVSTLPKKVLAAITNKFKDQSIKIGEDIKKVMVPNSQLPIYRVFVHVKHGETHTLKVNGNGEIFANTIN